MEEPLKKAFDAALDLVKQLITLSTGTLALTATFVKDILKVQEGHTIPFQSLLLITWGMMLLSIFCGLFAHAAIVGTLDGTSIVPDQKISPYDFNIRIWSSLQSIVFLLGIVFLIVYVSLSL